MNNAIRVTASVLAAYAGLLGMEHGFFEIMQGNIPVDGLMIQAIGAPCQPEAVWHACFPALTVLPNMLITGLAAMVVGLSMLAWAVLFVSRKLGGLILIVLSILLLPFGGGFVPVFIGLIAGVAGTRINTPPRWTTSGRLPDAIGRIWAWALGLLALWFPVSWIMGSIFPETMLDFGSLMFLLFDIGLPVLILLTGFLYEGRKA